jgi:broad specificity phosphatase PhoE
MLELIYETHATTTDNETGIATGWLPGELSARGIEQARELGQRRQDVDAVFCSDLGRALQTMELAFLETDLPIFLDWRLRECDYGDLNGVPASEVEAVRAQYVDTPFPNGESYHDVVARTDSFVRDVKRRWDGTRICVVAHSANRWALEYLANGTSLAHLVAQPFDWQPGWEFRL